MESFIKVKIYWRKLQIIVQNALSLCLLCYKAHFMICFYSRSFHFLQFEFFSFVISKGNECSCIQLNKYLLSTSVHQTFTKPCKWNRTQFIPSKTVHPGWPGVTDTFTVSIMQHSKSCVHCLKHCHGIPEK